MATIRRTLSNEDRVKITRFLSLHRGRTPCQFIEGDKRGSFSRSHHNRFLFARQKRPIDRDGLTINPLFFVLQGRNLLLYALQSDPNVFASARCLRCQSSYRKKEEPPRPPAKKKRPLQFSCALPCYIQHFSADVHGDNPATGSIGKIPSHSHRDFENVSSRMPQESPPEFSNSKEIRDSLDKIVPTRKSIVLLGQLS